MKNYVAEIATDDLDNLVLDPAWPQQNRNVGDIQKIIVHHEAQTEGLVYDDDSRYEAEAQYQNHSSIPGSAGLQYHFKIDNVGLINQVRPLTTILWHAGNLPVNNHSLAICLDGNFETQQPTLEQFEALKQLLDWLCTEHPEFPAVQADVYAHSEVIDKAYFPGGTACCGSNLRPFVIDYRNSGGNVALPDVPYQHPELQPAFAQPAPAAPAPDPTPAVPAPDPTPAVPAEPTPAPNYTVTANGNVQLATDFLADAYKEYLSLTTGHPSLNIRILTSNGTDITDDTVAANKPASAPDPTSTPSPAVPVPVTVIPKKPSTGFRLPDIDSATFKGIVTGLQVLAAQGIVLLTDPNIIHVVTSYAPGLLQYVTASAAVLAFIVGVLRSDVKLY